MQEYFGAADGHGLAFSLAIRLGGEAGANEVDLALILKQAAAHALGTRGGAGGFPLLRRKGLDGIIGEIECEGLHQLPTVTSSWCAWRMCVNSPSCSDVMGPWPLAGAGRPMVTYLFQPRV